MQSRMVDYLCIVALVASLPFFPMKITSTGMAVFHVSALLAISVMIIRPLDVMKVVGNSPYFSLPLLAYISIAGISLAITTQETGFVAWVKTLFYSLMFFAILSARGRVGEEKFRGGVVFGAAIGLTMFVFVLVYANFKAGAGGGITLSYYGLTIGLFKPVFEFFLSKEDFSSRDLMRSAMTEVFVLYAFLFWFYSKGKVNVILVLFCVLLSLGFFSRRGLVMLVIAGFLWWVSGLLSGKISGSKAIGISIFSFILAAVFVATFSETRLVDLEVSSRASQFEVAAQSINENIFMGVGYAAKVGGLYVHNMLIATWYMLGVAGLVPIILMTVFMLHRAAVSVRYSPVPIVAMFFCIPLVGGMVGSTTEGLYTPAAWLAMAFALSE